MQSRLFSLIDKAVFDYSLIENGDRILLGTSGGKDSTALAEYLANRKKRIDANFEFKCVFVQSDFSPPFPESISRLFSGQGISFEVVCVDISARLKPGRKMNCFWCSMQRRAELLHYAVANGFNKIALGHHIDDILETLLMNMTEKGELSTMPPKLKYKKYPVTLIRPLCYADEKLIIAHAHEGRYIDSVCTCGLQESSTRKHARSKLEFLTGGEFRVKMRMFNSLKNIRVDYLPELN